MIKLAVFDIAGTTLQDDNVVRNCFEQAFIEFNFYPSFEQIDDVMGMSKPEAIRLILEKLTGKDYFYLQLIIQDIHDKFKQLMLKHYSNPENVKEIPGTSKAFEYLKRNNILVALDTGFSREITDKILKNISWTQDNWIDAYISSDQVNAGRPYPYMIFKLMEKLRIQNVREVLKIGDTSADLWEGVNAGCQNVIGVLSGTGTSESFEDFESDYLEKNKAMPTVSYLNSVADLPWHMEETYQNET